MKVVVINFSGNVGKTTIARHLLAPRIAGAEVVSIESINADDGKGSALRGSQYGELQEYLQTIDNVVIDIGASSVEELCAPIPATAAHRRTRTSSDVRNRLRTMLR